MRSYGRIYMQTWVLACVAGIASLASISARASVSNEVQSIFDKNKRRLAPPPRSLRADKAQMDYRYSTGAERAEQLYLKEGNYAEATTALPTEADFENNVRSSPVTSPFSRDAYSAAEVPHRRKRKISSGFDGERVFGLGFVGAGAYGIFGLEADFTVAPQWSAGLGLGTGMAYTTWGAYARYYFKESTWNPFFQVGYANWSLQRTSKTGEKLSPEFLADRFFQDQNGNLQVGQRLHLVYPALGVLYQNPSGFAVSTQLQYFVSVNGFTGGLYGDVGFHFYF